MVRTELESLLLESAFAAPHFFFDGAVLLLLLCPALVSFGCDGFIWSPRKRTTRDMNAIRVSRRSSECPSLAITMYSVGTLRPRSFDTMRSLSGRGTRGSFWP